MNSNKTKKNRGITLIALVITIIVMLILVAVTITMAVNGGLFEYARSAGTQTNAAVANEQELANLKENMTVDELIDKYTGGDSGNELPVYTNAKFENNVLAENATYTNDGTAIVPKGFKVIPGINGSTKISDGLVIQDVDGNEFVWIPVKYTPAKTDTDNNGYDDGFDSVFYRSDWSNNVRGTTKYPNTGKDFVYSEPLSSGGYANEDSEYNAMVKSVYDNGGFYIGRYEAGSQDENKNPIARTDKANGTSKMVVQRDQYPYIYVGWGSTMSNYTSNVTFSGKDQGLGALALCKALYANKDVGVTSTLCYGVQWDAMLDFIKSEKNVTDSRTWGNYYDWPWTITRTTAKYTVSPSSDVKWSLIDGEENDKKEKPSEKSFLLTTGASDDFAAKNIFDVAGNVSERTNEASLWWAQNGRVYRGGFFSHRGYYYPASSRYGNDNNYSPDLCVNYIGFRPVLYISRSVT